MKINKNWCLVGVLVTMVVVSGGFLASARTYANDIIDRVEAIIPVSCTLAGELDTEHSATLVNGTYSATAGSAYENGIGRTTLTAICNDNDGFAIYAIGYTNEVDGTNTLEGQNTNAVINTGVYAVGDTDSSWAMKLIKVTDSTVSYLPNNLTITNSFDNYHAVPTDYAQVAAYHANTGSSATDTVLGSKLQTTYAVFASPTQVADNYYGKVKYMLVHPNSAPVPVIYLNFNSNGLSFADGKTTNLLAYEKKCEKVGYIGGSSPIISKTPNVKGDSTASSGYAWNYTQTDPITIPGADKLRIEVDYGIEWGDALYVVKGNVSENWAEEWFDDDTVVAYLDGGMMENFEAGASDVIYVDGDTVTLAFYADEWEDGSYYGYYAKVYPIYETEQSGTIAVETCGVDPTPVKGTYATTTVWNEYWYADIDGDRWRFEDESDIVNFLTNESDHLLGTTIELYAGNPYKVVYNGNGATAGTMDGFTIESDSDDDIVMLTASNFKKTGYGFLGWSENPNAATNGGTIYGPNEDIDMSDLTFNESTRQATLYAVWKASAGDMQGWTGCSSLIPASYNSGTGEVSATLASVTALTDTRDNNVYAVARLTDGKCWMIENLRLNAEDSRGATNKAKAQGYGESATYGNFIGLADSEDMNFSSTTGNSDPTVANSIYYAGTQSGTATIDIAQTKFAGQRMPRYNNNNTNFGGTNSYGISLVASPNGKYYYDYDQGTIGLLIFLNGIVMVTIILGLLRWRIQGIMIFIVVLVVLIVRVLLFVQLVGGYR